MSLSSPLFLPCLLILRVMLVGCLAGGVGALASTNPATTHDLCCPLWGGVRWWHGEVGDLRWGGLSPHQLARARPAVYGHSLAAAKEKKN